jgi:hypothetical protein
MQIRAFGRVLLGGIDAHSAETALGEGRLQAAE